MSDDDLAALLVAPDHRLAAIILAATGISATRADLRLWRSALRRLLHRRRRARQGELEPVAPVAVRRDPALGVVLNMLTSPEFALALSAIVAVGRLASGRAAFIVAAVRSLRAALAAARGMAPSALDRAHAYAAAKAALGGAASGDYWIATGLDPAVRAAINAMTPDRLAWWMDRRASARAAARPSNGVLRALAADGADVLAVYPDLGLDALTYGPPLAIWPPLPPPEAAPSALPINNGGTR
jgi:hypothetical protein